MRATRGKGDKTRHHEIGDDSKGFGASKILGSEALSEMDLEVFLDFSGVEAKDIG